MTDSDSTPTQPVTPEPEVRVRRPHHLCPGPNCNTHDTSKWIDDGVFHRQPVTEPEDARVLLGFKSWARSRDALEVVALLKDDALTAFQRVWAAAASARAGAGVYAEDDLVRREDVCAILARIPPQGGWPANSTNAHFTLPYVSLDTLRDAQREIALMPAVALSAVAGADFSDVSYAKLTAEQDTILQWLKDQGASHNEACASLSDLLERFPAPVPTSAVLDDETREAMEQDEALDSPRGHFFTPLRVVYEDECSPAPAPTSAVLDDETSLGSSRMIQIAALLVRIHSSLPDDVALPQLVHLAEDIRARWSAARTRLPSPEAAEGKPHG